MTQIEQIKAEIERQKHYSDNCVGDKYYYGWRVVCERLLAFLDTLEVEQPDVDLEDKFAKFLERKDAELGANSWSEEDLCELARHFYNLGLNSKK